jgi:diaminohydroxyphosphoribosylaminopyrimidine deaminase / 5-amino-6-(5-phosphoribosylamino)uracil reductase
VVTPDQDLSFMERALFWAERGRGRTTPNPLVGAVVVSPEGIVVGQGAHMVAGGPHAEVVALDAAGDRARGATLYCTLEPCSHTGRTGPCVERIVAAGITRVVAAMADPNPLVSGRGFDYLRRRGIEITVEVGEDEAAELNAPFFTWITLRRPFVIAKAATSRDGLMGHPSGRVKLTSEEADRYFHGQRAAIDAIAVGSGTVLVDDPLLTARGAYRVRPLTRVIFDWRGRVTPAARVFSTLEAGPVIMVVAQEAVAAQPDKFDVFRGAGVIIDARESRDLAAVLEGLAARDVVSLLVEGGPTLHAAFAEAELVDRAQWIVTPRELGDGVPPAPLFARLVTEPREQATVTTLGDDLLIEFDVHGADRNHRTH